VLLLQEKHPSTILCVMLCALVLRLFFALPTLELQVSYFLVAKQHIPCSRFLLKLWMTPSAQFQKTPPLLKLLKATVLIIWDECSAQHCFMFKAVNCTLRDLCNADGLFSGIMMVLGRDFLQTLPVIKTNLHSPIVHACLLSSSLWPAIKDFILKLERNMQVGPSTKEQSFATWLRQLATGTLNSDDETVALPRRILCPSDTIDDLVTHIYPDISHPHPASYFKECCILAPCNTETNDLNINVLRSFPGKEYKLWAIDHTLNHETFLEDDTNYSPEVLHTFTPLGFPVAQLILKVGCPIMILQNLQPREGVCNGS
jgi:ATP-dependent DNA helicase PIF1